MPGFSPQFLQLLFLVTATAIFYFVAIHPQRKKRKEREDMIKNVQKGDKIITIGGIYGVVTDVDDEKDMITVKVAEQTHLKMTRFSVGRLQEK